MIIDWTPLVLTFELAAVTTAILLVLGVPLAYALAFGRFRLKPVVETLVSMPLVLPPSVLGFYLLLTFSPENFIGRFLAEHFDLQLVFSFSGLVVGSVIFSLPFMVQPIQAGFQGLSSSLIEAADTLGKPRPVTFLRVLLPNIKPALLAGAVLSFGGLQLLVHVDADHSGLSRRLLIVYTASRIAKVTANNTPA